MHEEQSSSEAPIRSIDQAIVERCRFPEAVGAALKTARATKLWQGDELERIGKFQALHQALCAALDIKPFKLSFARLDGSLSKYRLGRQAGQPTRGTIYGKVSLVTYLWLMADAQGLDWNDSARWVVNVFRHYFPRSFAACRHKGMYLIAG